MTDRVNDEDQNCLFIQLWQEQIVMNISHKFYHLIQLVGVRHELAKFLQTPTLKSIKNGNKFCTWLMCDSYQAHKHVKKCIICHSWQITMKAADFSLRLCRNSVHLRTIQTLIWLGGLFVCWLVFGWVNYC
jgi:hypothetical protein